MRENRTSRRARTPIDSTSRMLLELQDVMGQPMAILDAGLRVQSANRRFYELFRLTPRRARGRPFVDLAAGLRVPDAGRVALYVGLKDITDVRRAETKERMAERERTQREFIANVSHELRTPVTAIKGYAQTLKQGGLEDKKRRLDFVDTIERNADRLTGLIDALLRISALNERPTPRRRPVRLSGLARRCAAAAATQARSNRVVLRVGVPAALKASADPGQIRDVLRALVDNAVKFSRPGGQVAIKAREAGGEAVVSVEDRGIGIPERDFPRLFERFFRGRNARRLPGSGLGLSIAQQIVAAHGGRIWADARRRRGAAFRFTLPLAGAQAPSRS